MHFRKTDANGEHTGALIEVFLLEPAEPADYEQMFQTTGHCAWYCLVGNLKKWKEGPLTRELTIENGTLTIKATRGPIHGTSHRIDFEWNGDVSFATIIDTMGELPIPPYLNRETQDSDKTTYQTVYSKIKGSVAAPTAGLHFTPEVLADLDAHGIEREELTLHVGAGTFKPVKSEEMEGHEMHTEYISVRRETITKLLNHDCQAIAVGTTSVRTLESLYYMGLKVLANPDLTEDQLHVSQWEPYHNGDCPLCEQRSELQGDCPQCVLPDEEQVRAMYYLLKDRLETAGFEHYEISNFAKPGFRSRHNSSYWTNVPYLGLGAAAHSFDGHTRSWNIADIHQYIEGIERGERRFESEPIEGDTAYNDMLTVALRTREGLDLNKLSEKHHAYCLKTAQRYIDAGLLKLKVTQGQAPCYLTLTREGLFVSDMVISDLMLVSV